MGERDITYLIQRVDDLLDEVARQKPVFSTAIDLAEHPVITLLSASLNMSGYSFAESVQNGTQVQFKIEQISHIKRLLEKIRDKGGNQDGIRVHYII